MEISRNDSIIELTAEEAEWLFGKKDAPTEALQGDGDFVYRSFRNKVEHLASEIYHGNSLTVMILAESSDDPIAVCNENGLVIEDQQTKEQSK